MVTLQFGEKHSEEGGSSATGKVFTTLFFLVFFVMGLFFEVIILRDFIDTIKICFWEKTPCVIIESSIVEKGNFELAIKYEYTYKSKNYISERFSKQGYDSDDYSTVNGMAREYSAGTESYCYVNPAQPSEAIIKRGNLFSGFWLLFPLIFVGVGGGGIYYTWRRKKKKPKPITAGYSKNEKSGVIGVTVLLLFFGIFAAVGGATGYFMLIRPVKKTLAARQWLKVPCKVISAEVGWHDGDDSTTYSVDIFYEYEVDGQIYKSNRYDFMGGSSSGYEGKSKIVDEYREAKEPVCYVNPENPHEAVLKRGFHAGLLLGLVPLSFLTVGVGGIIFIIRGLGKHVSKQAEWLPEISGVKCSSEVNTANSGPVVLKPKYSPIVKLLGVIAFATFWNGIVSIFVTDVVRGFMYGNPSWFQTLFMIPFVAVGLGAIGFAIYQFLACFNPRLKITISSGEIRLGGSVELKWEITGRTSVISNFKISLEGREEATYRRGTDTTTDKETFYEEIIFETDVQTQIPWGSIGLVIPDGSMHSFEAENNKIIWALKVHGDIKYWPDIKENFQISVLPAAV